ncbi:MAG: hypothetical protein ACK51T_04765, partial [bacterium]
MPTRPAPGAGAALDLQRFQLRCGVLLKSADIIFMSQDSIESVDVLPKDSGSPTSTPPAPAQG